MVHFLLVSYYFFKIIYSLIYTCCLSHTPGQPQQNKKNYQEIFCDNDLKITVKTNTSVVNFLDVMLDLRSGKFYTGYTKEGITPL